MGNKMCKKKSDTVDNSATATPKNKESRFDRIFTRLHLKPTTWKSDTQLNKKQVSRSEANNSKKARERMNNISTVKPLSKSTDWTSASLEVPEDEAHQVKNANISLTFNDKNAPTPPPRKHKRGIKEKIESVTKSGLQAMQNKKPVEEPMAVKRIIDYSCPLCDKGIKHHKHDKNEKATLQAEQEKPNNNESKLSKRKKNLSVVSLPNYNDLKLAVANFDDIDKKPDSTALHNCITNIPNGNKKLTHTSSTGKLESYMTRCRSFGSLLPQQLLDKLTKNHSQKTTEIESDDSFGGLEDWDLKIIEHYHPKDTSLPRPSKPRRTEKDVLSGLESMIVTEETLEPPTPPVRRSESPIKRIHKQASAAANKRKGVKGNRTESGGYLTITPPSSPILKKEDKDLPPPINYEKLPREEDGKIEHSSLMKILQEYSVKDKRRSKTKGEIEDDTIEFIDASSSSNKSSKHSSIAEYDSKFRCIEDFLNAEKQRTSLDMYAKYGNTERVKI